MVNVVFKLCAVLKAGLGIKKSYTLVPRPVSVQVMIFPALVQFVLFTLGSHRVSDPESANRYSAIRDGTSTIVAVTEASSPSGTGFTGMTTLERSGATAE